MPEKNAAGQKRFRRVRHTGRGSQVLIYLGKQLRFFIKENDWKVLPMAAVIAGLVAMVIRKRFFVNMEGSLIGAFALTCVAIWNGCFNSIQSVCRERAIIKREHRSGMHITAYVTAHMIYQFLLCTAQTVLTMFMLRQLQVPIPKEGFMTKWMLLDIGITMLLISYAADMMSLFLSSISRTTTGAMTLMPFILIFQLVFSGGVIPLPEWSRPLSDFTISNYGIHALASQSGYNEMPMTTVWNTVSGMRDSEIGGTVTLGQMLDAMDNPAVERHRDTDVIAALHLSEMIPEAKEELDAHPVTIGEIADFLRNSEELQANRDKSVSLKLTVGDVLDFLGEENVKNFVQEKTAAAAYKAEYNRTTSNIVRNWVMLGLFILAFAAMATIALELIDKDKR